MRGCGRRSSRLVWSGEFSSPRLKVDSTAPARLILRGHGTGGGWSRACNRERLCFGGTKILDLEAGPNIKACATLGAIYSLVLQCALGTPQDELSHASWEKAPVNWMPKHLQSQIGDSLTTGRGREERRTLFISHQRSLRRPPKAAQAVD
jgi:hypothetical protein